MASVKPAFEINQKRLAPGAADGLRVADNLSNWGIVVGAGETPDKLPELVSIGNDQGIIESVASDGHIDDHFESLAILAARLGEFGQTLSAGQHVITGAYGKAPFAPGHYVGHFDQGIGEVDITLT